MCLKEMDTSVLCPGAAASPLGLQSWAHRDHSWKSPVEGWSTWTALRGNPRSRPQGSAVLGTVGYCTWPDAPACRRGAACWSAADSRGFGVQGAKSHSPEPAGAAPALCWLLASGIAPRGWSPLPLLQAALLQPARTPGQWAWHHSLPSLATMKGAMGSSAWSGCHWIWAESQYWFTPSVCWNQILLPTGAWCWAWRQTEAAHPCWGSCQAGGSTQVGSLSPQRDLKTKWSFWSEHAELVERDWSLWLVMLADFKGGSVGAMWKGIYTRTWAHPAPFFLLLLFFLICFPSLYQFVKSFNVLYNKYRLHYVGAVQMCCSLYQESHCGVVCTAPVDVSTVCVASSDPSLCIDSPQQNALCFPSTGY